MFGINRIAVSLALLLYVGAVSAQHSQGVGIAAVHNGTAPGDLKWFTRNGTLSGNKRRSWFRWLHRRRRAGKAGGGKNATDIAAAGGGGVVGGDFGGEDLGGENVGDEHATFLANEEYDADVDSSEYSDEDDNEDAGNFDGSEEEGQVPSASSVEKSSSSTKKKFFGSWFGNDASGNGNGDGVEEKKAETQSIGRPAGSADPTSSSWGVGTTESARDLDASAARALGPASALALAATGAVALMVL